MLNVTTAFNEAFKSDLREVKMRIKINDVTYTDEDIVSFNYNAGSIVGESFAIGSTFANTVRLTLCRIVEGLKQLDEVIPEMGIVLPDKSIEWVKLGTFIISEEVNPDRNENRTSLECTDKMIMLDDIYESKLKYPARIRDVALEIANLAGVEIERVSFGRLMVNTIQKPVGYTYRQALGLIAQFEAGYVCFDRNGLLAIKQLEDKNYQVTPNEYFLKGLTKNELMFRPAGIQVKVNSDTEEDKVLKIGNEKGSVIHLENKVMTDGLLKLVYDKVKNINYYPYTLKWRGNPAIEVGDWLQVTDTKGNLFKVPNLSYSFEYKGGLTATSTVETVASNEVRFGYKGILDQTVEYVENALKDVGGNLIYYGVEAPPNPKEGDTWFKYVDSDTEIWVYEKVGEPDVFDWVFKISSAVDDSIKEKIDELEQQSKDQQINIDKALSDAEKAREEAEVARQEAFDSSTIAKQAEKDALDALLKGDQNSTQITTLEGQQKLTNTKVEGNTANILNLQTDSEKLSLSIGKVQADVDGINVGLINLASSKHNGLDTTNNDYWLVSIPQANGQSLPFKWKRDTEYTVVMKGYVKNEGGSLRALIQNIPNYTFNQSIIINSTEPTVVTKTFRTLNDDTVLSMNINIYNYNKTNGVHMDWIMVFEGNKAPKEYVQSQYELTTNLEFATFEANYKGFQQTVNSDITGLKSQQTQMAGQITSTIEKVDNLEFNNRNLVIGTPNPDIWFSSPQSSTSSDYTSDTKWVYPNDWGIGDFFRGFNFTTKTDITVSSKIKIEKVNGQPLKVADFPEDFVFSVFRITGTGTSWRDFAKIRRGQLKDGVSDYFVSETFKLTQGDIDTNYQNKFIRKWMRKFPDGYKVTLTEYILSSSTKQVLYQPAPEDNASKSQVTQLSDQITQTVNKVETVDGKVTSQQSQITQLSDNINLKVDKDNVIAQINLSHEQVLIQAKRIHLSGESRIDDAIITNAMIKDVSADKMTVGTLNASNVNIINLNASNIVSGTINAIDIKGSNISGGTITSFYDNNEYSLFIQRANIDFIRGAAVIGRINSTLDGTTGKANGMAITHIPGEIFSINTKHKTNATSTPVIQIPTDSHFGDAKAIFYGSMNFRNAISIGTNTSKHRIFEVDNRLRIDNEYGMDFAYNQSGTLSYIARFMGGSEIKFMTPAVSGGAVDIGSYGTRVWGNFNVYNGSKNAVHVTRDGMRATPAYETAESYLGDIGSNVTSDKCSVVIDIETLFSDTVNTIDYEYQVFLQSYGEGLIWVSKRDNHSFTVRSSKPNVKFGWEIKARRRGYEKERLVLQNNDFSEIDEMYGGKDIGKQRNANY